MQRFSIIPARAILDKTLTDLDIRVLGVFGIHADTETGWCFRNQSKIAEQLGVARQSISRSCNRLYAAGYVEARDINAGKKGLRSINCYRIILDSKAEPNQAVIDALSPCGDNEARRCHPAETTVVTLGRQLNVPLITDNTPLPPKGGDCEKIDHGKGDTAPPAPQPTPAARSAPHSPGFEAAWKAYPGTDKAAAGPQAAAWGAWQAEGCDQDAAAVLVGIKRYAADMAAASKRQNAPNIQHMHRWLKKRRWEGIAIPAAPAGPHARRCAAVVEVAKGVVEMVDVDRAGIGLQMRALLASLKGDACRARS